MADMDRYATSDYFAATRSVIDAGRMLGDVLEADRQTVLYMSSRLEGQLVKLDTDGATLRELAFESLDHADAAAATEPAVDEVLTTVLLDVQVGRLAVAAGHAAGEAGPPLPRDEYYSALADLEASAGELEAAPASLGFEEAAERKAIESADEASARKTFLHEAETGFATIVEETTGVVEALVKAIKELPVMSALDELLSRAKNWRDPPPKIGRLVRLGLRKLKQAVEALARFLRLPAIEHVREHLAPYWQELTGEGVMAGVVRRAADVPDSQRRVRAALASAMDTGRIDGGSSDVRELSAAYRSRMEKSRRLVRAFALAASTTAVLATVVAGLDLYIVAVSSAAYLLVLAWLLLTARDHADSGGGLGQTRGIASIAAALAAT